MVIFYRRRAMCGVIYSVCIHEYLKYITHAEVTSVLVVSPQFLYLCAAATASDTAATERKL